MPRPLIAANALRHSASFVLALLFLYGLAHFLLKIFGGFAWDFAINWTAALALRHGIPLYDATALQALAMTHIDDGMRQLFNGPFQRYISLPTTAMLLTPFSLLPFELATLLYRSVMLLALIIGTRLALRDQPTLPPTALVLSVVLVMLWQPARTSLQLGQVDGWIVLALGLTLFAVSRQRPWLAGIGIGVATLLKISPALLLLHCLLRRQWSTVLAGGLTILAGIILCALPQHGDDLKTFVWQVTPTLRHGTAHAQNQALGAVLARLAAGPAAPTTFFDTPGQWQWVGLLPAVLLLPSMAWQRRQQPLHPLELGCCIVLALLAGPLSWDHYSSWALLPAALLLHRADSRWITLPAVLPFLFALPVSQSHTAPLISWAIGNNAYVIGHWLLLFSCLWALLRQCQSPSTTVTDAFPHGHTHPDTR